MTVDTGARTLSNTPRIAVLCDEGFRLFFPLAAIHAAAWPFLWVVVHGLSLPFARSIPTSLWHAHEMLIGAFGAALIGFITTAVPEWTDTERLRGRPLVLLFVLWSVGRVIGLLGADALTAVGALTDLAWLLILVGYVCRVSIARRTGRILGFIGWLIALFAAEATTRYGLLIGDIALAQRMTHCTGFVFLGLLGLAIARITVPVTNLVLDPSEATSPFRPHPGRLNLAPGLMAVAILGDLMAISAAATGFLMIAAGAAFLDRVSEAFIGRGMLRAEILALAGTSALAGAGLILVGAARLNAPFPEVVGLHVAMMGGLGLGVLTVFSIAGLRHTGRPLGFALWTKVALLCLVGGVILRALPGLGLMPPLPGPPHAVSAILWASAFLAWLKVYWPALTDAATLGTHTH